MRIEILFGSHGILEALRNMKAEVFAKVEELKSVIEAEKAEAQEVIKDAVAKAIAPLETEILDLKAKIESQEQITSEELTEVAGNLSEAIEAVKGIVSVESAE